ncbi:3538_t:CDS:2 [Funneliformis mosseae]|uniref:3538_t:CDS:1 n=1 Tax=Funneliformis mosseae TaxID=27381 RepID=A0A9N8ZBW5_FUNMO|nr:3538_t:CDS:2 [Funneliformis mosseae]
MTSNQDLTQNFEFYPGLSQHFSQLLNDNDDYDIIIKVGANTDAKEFRAHSLILKAHICYTGILNLNKQIGNDILELLVASDELMIEELINFINEHLFGKQNEWLQQNIVKVLHTVSQLEIILPPRHRKIAVDSIVIKPKHAAILANWIQRTDVNAKFQRITNIILNSLPWKK